MEVYRRSSGLLLLLGLSLLATTLQGVQGEVELEGPSESECRPYIEKALKELEAGETAAGSSAEEGDGDSKEDIPTVEITTDDSAHQDGDGEKDDTNEDGQDSNENGQIVSEKIEPEVRPSVIQKISSFFQKVFQKTPSKKEEPPVESKQSDDKQDDDSQEHDQATTDDVDSKEADSKEDESNDDDTQQENESSEVQEQDTDDNSKEDDNKDEDDNAEQGDSKEEQGDSVEQTNDDVDDSKEDDATQQNVEEDNEQDGDSKEVAEQEDDSKETEQKDDSEEAAQEDDSKEAAHEDNSKEDRAPEDDSKEEAAHDDDSQEEPAQEADDKSDEQRDSLEERIEAEIIEHLTRAQIQQDDDSKEDEQTAEAEDQKESVEDQAQSDEEKLESKEDTKDDDSKDNTEGNDKDTNEDTNDDESTEVEQGRHKRSIDDSQDDGVDSKEDEKNSKEAGLDSKEDSKEDKVESKEEAEDTKDDGIDSKEGDSEDSDKSDEKADPPSDEDNNDPTQNESTEKVEDKKDDDSKEDNKQDDKDDDKDDSKEGKDDSKEGKDDIKSAEDDKDSKEQDDKDSKEIDANEDDKSDEDADGGPVEDLYLDADIPTDLRSREHVEQLLKLDDQSSETETIINRVSDITLRDLKKLYENAIKPLEVLYKYRDLSNRHFGDSEIFSKPLILFMGPWSGGKSSIINYLTNNEYNDTALRTGAEPSPAYFNILMHGEEPEVIDGTELAADFTFSGLQKFGQGLEERLRGVKLPSKLLEKVNIVEIPGILEVRKQVSRVFPFNDACQWFIDRGDIIFLVYDPSKLDVGPETEAILDQLKGREHQTRIILNKADQVKPEELLRVQGALIWNISPLMSSPQPPIMYTTSLWSRPYEQWAPVRLLQAQERAFLRDLRGAVDKRIENKIASARRFAVRVRNHAKMVDCYLTTYYNHKSVFGNRKQVADAIIEHPQDYHIYEGLSTLTNISRYDLPDPDVYKDFFKLNPLYEFQQLSATCTYFRGCPINRLDIAIAYDLPELLGTHRKRVETALTEGASGPQQQTSAPGS